ncbi:hypothetical protein LJC17_03965 [Acholeplasma sp. OttesenSCG-928-E16]|nr:hypothetical protein [Acholeplasma sp. OttesenSCG-928-E16]
MQLFNIIFFDLINFIAITLVLFYLAAMVFYLVYQMRTIKYIENQLKSEESELKSIYTRVSNRYKNILIFSGSILLYALIFFIVQLVLDPRLTPIMIIVSLVTTLFFAAITTILNLFFYNYIEGFYEDPTKTNKTILVISGIISSFSLCFILLGVMNIFL